MKRHLNRLLVSMAVALALTACHRRESNPARSLEKEFGILAPAPSQGADPVPAPSTTRTASAAEPTTRSLAEQAAVSMRHRNYAAAVMNLEALQDQPQLTPPQRVAVQRAIESMQTELALKLSRGDLAARRQAEELRKAAAH